MLEVRKKGAFNVSYFIHTVVATILHLKRICPSCKREQIVKAKEKHSVVKCKFCGAEIPPKK